MKPLGEDGARLAAAPAERKLPRQLAIGRSQTHAIPRAETPLQRLERVLGPAGAARALRAFEAERRTR